MPDLFKLRIFLKLMPFIIVFDFFPKPFQQVYIVGRRKQIVCLLALNSRVLCVYKMAFFMHVIVLFSILFCLNCLGIIICVCRLLHKWMNHQTNQISIVIAVGFFLRHNYLCIVLFTIYYWLLLRWTSSSIVRCRFVVMLTTQENEGKVDGRTEEDELKEWWGERAS